MPLNVPCDVTDSIRLRSSRSNPFMTDRTVISVATPSISPSTDIRATNETNPRRCVERRYRMPINHSYALLITKSFGRLGAGSANRRIYRRKARQQQRTHTDDDDVGPADIRRDRRHVIDIRIEDLEVERLLEERHQRVDIESNSQAHNQAQSHTQPADHQSLSHEDAHDPPGGGAEGTKNRDIGALVSDHHDQHGDDVEGRHGHNHHQDQGHHGLFDAYGAEVVGVVLRPVEQLEIVGKLRAQLIRQCRRGQRVTESDSQTLSCAAAWREPSDIIDVREDQRALLGPPDLENAGYRELPEPGGWGSFG